MHNAHELFIRDGAQDSVRTNFTVPWQDIP
jgi:hypothetical protein